MSNRPKTRHVKVRIEDDLATALEFEAERERRPTAALIRNMLADAIAARRADAAREAA